MRRKEEEEEQSERRRGFNDSETERSEQSRAMGATPASPRRAPSLTQCSFSRDQERVADVRDSQCIEHGRGQVSLNKEKHAVGVLPGAPPTWNLEPSAGTAIFPLSPFAGSRKSASPATYT